jgi:hypothetical protein
MKTVTSSRASIFACRNQGKVRSICAYRTAVVNRNLFDLVSALENDLATIGHELNLWIYLGKFQPAKLSGVRKYREARCRDTQFATIVIKIRWVADCQAAAGEKTVQFAKDVFDL